ncbi:hypothetical protein Btru_049476 [Bulinus truncatus]|nr:hypothetical protein Btru_049476 [Bulinus truncatus]
MISRLADVGIVTSGMVIFSFQNTVPDQATFGTPLYSATTQATPLEEPCCSGVLGYASDNVSLNFPCQNRPCCNSSEAVSVVPIDHAMGFRFQCMPRSSIQPLCYEYGTEVMTSNQDPDFIPRACCEGLKFKIVLNQWYAALVVKCVEEDNKDDDYS